MANTTEFCDISYLEAENRLLVVPKKIGVTKIEIKDDLMFKFKLIQAYIYVVEFSKILLTASSYILQQFNTTELYISFHTPNDLLIPKEQIKFIEVKLDVYEQNDKYSPNVITLDYLKEGVYSAKGLKDGNFKIVALSQCKKILTEN